MLISPFYVCEIVEIHHQKKFNYMINIYFNIFKKKDKVHNDFKDWTLKISNKFDVWIVYVFKVGIIRLI